MADVLATCDFNVIYEKEDYLFAKELPGNVNFSKLVSVEVVIDNYSPILRASNTSELEMSLVIKNEELPLQRDNHCRRKFDLVKQAIAKNTELELTDAA
ncbi:MAG: hypothetical protein WBA10_10720 [Elainellaceae cyanobacterium]